MDKLLTAEQVSEMLICHPQSVYRNKELPRTKIPGVGLRYRERDIQKYLEDRTIKPFSFSLQNTDIKRFSSTYSPENSIILSGGESELSKSKSKTRYNFGYGAIYKRMTKNGKIRWYIDYRDYRGKRIQQVASNAITANDANESLKDAVFKEHNKKCGIEQTQKRIKFKDFSKLYIENYAKINKRSWKDDQYRIEAHMNSFFGGLELQEIDPLLIEKYRASRLKTVSKSIRPCLYGRVQTYSRFHQKAKAFKPFR